MAMSGNGSASLFLLGWMAVMAAMMALATPSLTLLYRTIVLKHLSRVRARTGHLVCSQATLYSGLPPAYQFTPTLCSPRPGGVGGGTASFTSRRWHLPVHAAKAHLPRMLQQPPPLGLHVEWKAWLCRVIL